nr:immunoglobulin heavy chain junction region [Mus musculus]
CAKGGGLFPFAYW